MLSTAIRAVTGGNFMDNMEQILLISSSSLRYTSSYSNFNPYSAEPALHWAPSFGEEEGRWREREKKVKFLMGRRRGMNVDGNEDGFRVFWNWFAGIRLFGPIRTCRRMDVQVGLRILWDGSDPVRMLNGLDLDGSGSDPVRMLDQMDLTCACGWIRFRFSMFFFPF